MRLSSWRWPGSCIGTGRDERDEDGRECGSGHAAGRGEAGCGRNVRAAIPALEAFYAEHGTYAGADVFALRRDYDSGISPTVKLGWVETGRYCLESTVEGQTASVTGPGGGIVLGGC